MTIKKSKNLVSSNKYALFAFNDTNDIIFTIPYRPTLRPLSVQDADLPTAPFSIKNIFNYSASLLPIPLPDLKDISQLLLNSL